MDEQSALLNAKKNLIMAAAEIDKVLSFCVERNKEAEAAKHQRIVNKTYHVNGNVTIHGDVR